MGAATAFTVPQKTHSPAVAPFGSWRSPISSDLVASESMWVFEPRYDGDRVYWAEGRPSEGGRVSIVCREPGGETRDLFKAPFSARTRVHEYGGGAYAVSRGQVLFVNFGDQQIYGVREGTDPVRITSEDGLRHADLLIDPGRTVLFAFVKTTGKRRASQWRKL